MSFDFHKDRLRYFQIQYENSMEYIVPFVKDHLSLNLESQILEIGCGEGGVMKAFTDLGCQCLGIELSENRAELGKQFMREEIDGGLVQFISRDIYLIDPQRDLDTRFDLIILKDVIEHIHDQQKLMNKLSDFLKPNGMIFFGFPPWYMPFGGHQQMCESKFLSKLPYYHLLPRSLYKGILKLFGESEKKIFALIEIKDTGISIERFRKICTDARYRSLKETHYLINPIYKWKFGRKARKQFPFITNIPFIRNFFTTCVYSLIQKED